MGRTTPRRKCREEAGEREEEKVEKMEEEEDDSAEEEKEESGDEDEEEEEESSSDGEAAPVEYLVNKRERRANAGNKMAVLLEDTVHEDEFYKTAYGGGFAEDDVDDVYESPGHSDNDEVDSDFDRPEEEDEPVSDPEATDKPKRRTKKATGYKEPKRGGEDANLLAKHKSWAMARMGGNQVPANKVDDATQEERLKEAEETEKANVESLKKYEEFELEKKRKREKAGPARKVALPLIHIEHKENGTVMVVPDVRKFAPPKKSVARVCAVTGRPAKYRDPVTGLPYSTPFAFKVIRDQYHKHLKTLTTEEAKAYMSQFY